MCYTEVSISYKGGSYSFLLFVACEGIPALERLINRFQKFGATTSQIILSTPVDRSAGVM